MSKWNLKENSKGELDVTIEGEAWNEAQAKTLNKYLKNLVVKGFRKGQAPRNIALKHINAQHVLLDAAESIFQTVLDEELAEHKIKLIDKVDVKISEINEDKIVVKFILTVQPTVELKKYKGLGYKVEEVVITDEDVDFEIKRVQERYADLEIKESNVVENGDSCVIDYEGFIDGVAFDGGKGEGYTLNIGSNTFIPGFEEQLIGMKKEEERDVNVTFPDEYQVDDLRNKAAVFKVKLHEIKVMVLPELNDEFVADLKLDGINTPEELKTEFRKRLIDMKTKSNTNEAEDKLFNQLLDNHTIEIPDIMIEKEIDEIIKEHEYNLRNHGFRLEKYFEMTGQTIENLRQDHRDQAYKRVKLNLILNAIIEKENIQCDPEELDNEIKEIAEMYVIKSENVKDHIPLNIIENEIQLRKAMELIKN